MRFRLTLCTALLLGAATAQAAPPDVAGIHTGMTLEAARAQAQKTNPAYQFGDMSSNGQVVGFSARDASNGFDQIIVLATDDGKVWMAGREQHYPAGKRYALDSLKQSLTEKYGPYGDHTFDRQWLWDFDTSGKQYKAVKGAGPSPCLPANISGGGINWQTLSDMLGVPKRFPESCGQRIVSSAKVDSDKMVNAMSVQVIDSAAMLAQIKRQNAQAEARKKQSLDAEKAANKPKL